MSSIHTLETLAQYEQDDNVIMSEKAKIFAYPLLLKYASDEMRNDLDFLHQLIKEKKADIPSRIKVPYFGYYRSQEDTEGLKFLNYIGDDAKKDKDLIFLIGLEYADENLKNDEEMILRFLKLSVSIDVRKYCGRCWPTEGCPHTGPFWCNVENLMKNCPLMEDKKFVLDLVERNLICEEHMRYLPTPTHEDKIITNRIKTLDYCKNFKACECRDITHKKRYYKQCPKNDGPFISDEEVVADIYDELLLRKEDPTRFYGFLRTEHQRRNPKPIKQNLLSRFLSLIKTKNI